MARRKPIESFEHDAIEFDLEGVRYRVTHLDADKMVVGLCALDDDATRTLPFAHLPKAIKKKIRPL